MKRKVILHQRTVYHYLLNRGQSRDIAFKKVVVVVDEFILHLLTITNFFTIVLLLLFFFPQTPVSMATLEL